MRAPNSGTRIVILLVIRSSRLSNPVSYTPEREKVPLLDERVLTRARIQAPLYGDVQAARCAMLNAVHQRDSQGTTMPMQTVNSAQLMCSFGTSPSSLVILPTNRVECENQF